MLHVPDFIDALVCYDLKLAIKLGLLSCSR